MGFDGYQLSLAGPLSTGLDEPALLKRQRANLIFQSGASRSTPARISAALRPITASSCHWRCRIDPLYRPQTTPIFSKAPRPSSTRPADLKFAPSKNTCEKSGLNFAHFHGSVMARPQELNATPAFFILYS